MAFKFLNIFFVIVVSLGLGLPLPAAAVPTDDEVKPELDWAKESVPAGFQMERLYSHCQQSAEPEDHVVRSDFASSIDPRELLKTFKRLYESGKRLFQRAYYDKNEGQVRMRLRDSMGFVDINIQIPIHSIRNISGHMEEAMVNRFGEIVAYPDMGHVHVNSEKASYDEVYGEYDQEHPEFYKKMFNHTQTGMLYHTAETMNLNPKSAPQVFPQEFHSGKEYLKHRLLNRNLFGLNNGSRELEVLVDKSAGTRGNLVNNVSGYVRSMTLYFHANKNGCFPYVRDGKVEYYDVSMTIPAGADAEEDPDK